MSGAELIAEAQAAGVRLSLVDQWIRYEPRSKLPKDLAERIRRCRGEVIAALELEEWRARVWAELERRPEVNRYWELDAEGDPVRYVLALRNVGTVDLIIDKDRWNVEKFLELLDAPTEPEN